MVVVKSRYRGFGIWSWCCGTGSVWLRQVLLAVVALWLVLSLWLFTSLQVDWSLNSGEVIAKRFETLWSPFGGDVGTESSDLRSMATDAAERHGVDAALFHALVGQESAWNPVAVSHKGAAGLTQLMPLTALEFCGLSSNQRFEPDLNLDCGARYFAAQLDRFGDVQLALCAYNAGPGKVTELGRCPRFKETQQYVTRILAGWSRYVAKGGVS